MLAVGLMQSRRFTRTHLTNEMGQYPTKGWVTEKGYIRVVDPTHPWPRVRGQIYEHVRRMELKLGRRLRHNESVHHKNENKLDNRLNNLELLPYPDHAHKHWSKQRRDRLGRFAKRKR